VAGQLDALSNQAKPIRFCLHGYPLHWLVDLSVIDFHGFEWGFSDQPSPFLAGLLN
jgi:hypothetical protein